MTIRVYPMGTQLISWDIKMQPTPYGKELFSPYLKSDWVQREEKKKETPGPMANETITRSFKLAENNHTEYSMDTRFVTGCGTKVRMTDDTDPSLKDFLESAKVGDSFLFVLVKQSKG